MKIQTISDWLGHQGAIYKIFYDATQRSLWSTGGDGWLVSWDLNRPDGKGTLIARDQDKFVHMLMVDRQAILASLDGHIVLIDTHTKTLTCKIKAHARGVYGLAWDPLGNRLYSGGADGKIKVWQFPDMILMEEAHFSPGRIRCLCIDAPNRMLYVGGENGWIEIVFIDGGLNLHHRKRIHQKTVLNITFIDENLLISSGLDALITSLNPNTLQIANQFAAHWYAIYDLALHPHLPVVASASRDKTIRLWTIPDLKPITTIKSHSHSVNSLCWHEAENVLFSAGDDRCIRAHRMVL